MEDVRQSAFRKNNIASTAFITDYNDIVKSMDQSKITFLYFFLIIQKLLKT